ncbi:MAG: hypothetical protein NTZ30_17970, partial [Planctomycetota bacterium]|nr:hypothetical protein [Planctomycetota bacterium]
VLDLKRLLRYFINIFNRCTSSVNSPLRIREVDKGGATRVTNTREAGPNLRQDSTRSRPRFGFVFHCPLISGHRVDKININHRKRRKNS